MIAVLGRPAAPRSPARPAAATTRAGAGGRRSPARHRRRRRRRPSRPITGERARPRERSAALKETGGGKVTETEAGDEEGYYEVEVTKADGSQVDVQLDRGFDVVDSKADDEDRASDEHAAMPTACRRSPRAALVAAAAARRRQAALPRGDEHVVLDPADFTTRITNPYWPMRPGHALGVPRDGLRRARGSAWSSR